MGLTATFLVLRRGVYKPLQMDDFPSPLPSGASTSSFSLLLTVMTNPPASASRDGGPYGLTGRATIFQDPQVGAPGGGEKCVGVRGASVHHQERNER